MAEGTRQQEVRTELLEMMKDFERKQKVWRREAKEHKSKSFDELKTLIGGLSLQNQEVLVNQGAYDGSTPSAATVGKISD